MADLDWAALILRWMHILAASAALGGTLFMRVALVPALAEQPESVRQALHVRMRQSWSVVVYVAILFLLVSGLLNFLFWKIREPDLPAAYHPLFGIKFLLSLVVFFVASALVGRSPALARMRENRRLWLSINLALLVLIVLIAGLMRALPRKPPVTPTTVQTALGTHPARLTRPT